MPLRRMLEEARNLDPKAAALLLDVFDDVVSELDLRTGADRRKAAKFVLRLALGSKNVHQAEIHDKAVRLVRKQGMGRRRPF